MKVALSLALLFVFFAAPPQQKPSPGACDHAAPPAGMRWSCAADDACDCHLVPAGPGEAGEGGITESPAAAEQCLVCAIRYFDIPAYPDAARRAGKQGTVSAGLLLNDDGTVRKVSIATGDPELAEAASVALRSWRFAPGLRVRIIPVSVKFVLADSAAGSVSGTSLLNLVVTGTRSRK